MRRRITRVVVSGCLIAWSHALVAGEPAAEPAKPSAAELVAGIITAENKVNEVKSLYLRFEGNWTVSGKEIERRRGEYKKQNPNIDPTPERFSDLRPRMAFELELAFDERRVRWMMHQHESMLDVRVFDGTRAVSYSKYFTHEQEGYGLLAEPHELFQSMLTNLSWARVGTPKLWFARDGFTAERRAQVNGRPDDFELAGEADFRGRRCYVLNCPAAQRRLHVGVDDRRLHGLSFLKPSTGIEFKQAIARAAGRTFADDAEEARWEKGLSEDERRAFAQRFQRELIPLMRPWVVHFLDDYREIGPGFSFPAKQGYRFIEDGDENAPPTSQSELRLVEARVNEALADDLFVIELKDGIQVYDGTHDPPLYYKQKADRTPEEWQAIVDEHKRQNDDWKQQNVARDALVGKPAPELPAGKWLNSPPLSLTALRGKVIVLDFWSTTCAPCMNDLPQLVSIHKDSASTGIVVIGVHSSGGEVGEVEKFAKRWKLMYPVLIDLPAPDGAESFSLMANQLHVHGIPYSYVIDREGRLAAHGSLPEVLGKAYELARPANQ